MIGLLYMDRELKISFFFLFIITAGSSKFSEYPRGSIIIVEYLNSEATPHKTRAVKKKLLKDSSAMEQEVALFD